jgi:hypothetical protein
MTLPDGRAPEKGDSMDMNKRFSICMAYFVYAMLWTRNGYTNRYHNIYTQLERMRFRAGPLIKDPKDLDKFGLEVYNNLVKTYHGTQDEPEHEYEHDSEHLEDEHLNGWLNDR